MRRPRASFPPPRPKVSGFWGVAGGTIERSCCTSPTCEDRGRLRGRPPGSSAIRAAKQQTGTGPVTAGAIGSGSAALVG